MRLKREKKTHPFSSQSTPSIAEIKRAIDWELKRRSGMDWFVSGDEWNGMKWINWFDGMSGVNGINQFMNDNGMEWMKRRGQGGKQLNNHQLRHDFGPAIDWFVGLPLGLAGCFLLLSFMKWNQTIQSTPRNEVRVDLDLFVFFFSFNVWVMGPAGHLRSNNSTPRELVFSFRSVALLFIN